jgi:hypothetical protein
MTAISRFFSEECIKEKSVPVLPVINKPTEFKNIKVIRTKLIAPLEILEGRQVALEQNDLDSKFLR